MFKRFQVIDLFDGNKDLSVSEWVDVKKEIPDTKSGIYMVKLHDQSTLPAYFCQDRCIRLCDSLGMKEIATHWWDKKTKEPLQNVTHWGR